jgi:hypothetical protein
MTLLRLSTLLSQRRADLQQRTARERTWSNNCGLGLTQSLRHRYCVASLQHVNVREIVSRLCFSNCATTALTVCAVTCSEVLSALGTDKELRPWRHVNSKEAKEVRCPMRAR